MDTTAVFKISYGLFFLGSEFENEKNICVVNTVAQVTQEPLRLSVTILKSNYTAEIIMKSLQFSVGVMGDDVNLDDIAHFGQQSGHDIDKLVGYDYTKDALGNPLFSKGCIATLCAKVIQTVDLGTHYLFIADLVDASVLSDKSPITYNDYRAMKAGTKKVAEVGEEKQAVWQCSVCHYIYNGDIPFEELPDDYVCPVCKKPKSVFVKI